MSPLSPIFPVFVYLIAYFTGYLLYTKHKINTAAGRYETIDGLRGFLALGVFTHHSYIWYLLLHGAGRNSPKSHLHNQLEQTSVSLFFMITSFLYRLIGFTFSSPDFADWCQFITFR